MATTTPTTAAPASPTTTIQVEAVAAQTFIQKHERFFLVTLGILAMLYLGNRFLDGMETRDRAAATQVAQVLTQQQATNQALAAQIAINQKQLADLVTQMNQQNAVLQTQATQRTVVLTQQVAADKTLPMPDLGNRWAQLAQLKPGDITASTAGITVTPEGAQDTVSQLEQVPVLQANLTDMTTQKGNLSTVLDSSDALQAQQQQEIAGLQSAAVDKDKVCKANLAVANAAARKSKWKMFGIGVGVGAAAVTALVLHALL